MSIIFGRVHWEITKKKKNDNNNNKYISFVDI